MNGLRTLYSPHIVRGTIGETLEATKQQASDDPASPLTRRSGKSTLKVHKQRPCFTGLNPIALRRNAAPYLLYRHVTRSNRLLLSGRSKRFASEPPRAANYVLISGTGFESRNVEGAVRRGHARRPSRAARLPSQQDKSPYGFCRETPATWARSSADSLVAMFIVNWIF